MKLLLCILFEHRWQSYLVAGDHCEPAEDRCERCNAVKEVIGLCRCLIPCECVETTLPSGHRCKLNHPKS